jgi:hypothetical protein
MNTQMDISDTKMDISEISMDNDDSPPAPMGGGWLKFCGSF